MGEYYVHIVYEGDILLCMPIGHFWESLFDYNEADDSHSKL